MSKRILMCVALALVLAASATAADVESRTHYVIADKNGMPLYHATVITTNTENLSTEVYLVEDPAGQRVRIDIQRSYRNRLVTAEYRLNDARPVKVKLELPGKSSSRSETIREMREHPELRSQDIPVTVESLGQLLRTSDNDWKGNGQARQKAKLIVGAGFLAAMRNLSSLLAFPQFGGACSTFQFVSDGAKCTASTNLMTAMIKPDCDFDNQFSMPCNNEQKSRAKSQPANGRVGRY